MTLTRRQAIAALVAARAWAQDADVTFSTNVKVVSILATVLNKLGQIVHDLSKDDFAVWENGRPQTIKYFSRDTDLPLTLGLMVDTSMSQVHVIESERAASFRFIDQVLRENKDKVFVMKFDMAVQTSQELTSSRDKLRESLAFVDTPTRNELRNQYGGGTLLFDAVVKGVAGDYDPAAGQESAHRHVGWRREWQRRLDAGSHRRGAPVGHHGLFHFVRREPKGGAFCSGCREETGGGYFEVTKKFDYRSGVWGDSG